MNETLDSRQLRAFVSLARNRSFTLAAKELFLTQSAVSHALKALENDLGCRLFDRAGRRIVLTLAGERLLLHAQGILSEMKSARLGVEEVAQEGHGRVRLGASTTACQHLLPRVLRDFRERYPRCVIRIEPGDHGQQLQLLREGNVDLALIIEPPASAQHEFAFMPVFEDELRFLVPPSHPWAALGHAPRAAIGAETLVLYNKTSYTFRLVSDYFRAEGVAMNNTIELGSMEAIKELVKIGIGAGVLAPWIARGELEAGTLKSLPLGGRRLGRTWGVAHLRGRCLSAAEHTFVGLCVSACEALGLTTVAG